MTHNQSSSNLARDPIPTNSNDGDRHGDRRSSSAGHGYQNSSEDRDYRHSEDRSSDNRRKRKIHGLQYNNPDYNQFERRKRFAREEIPGGVSSVPMDDWVRTPGNTPWRHGGAGGSDGPRTPSLHGLDSHRFGDRHHTRYHSQGTTSRDFPRSSSSTPSRRDSHPSPYSQHRRTDIESERDSVISDHRGTDRSDESVDNRHRRENRSGDRVEESPRHRDDGTFRREGESRWRGHPRNGSQTPYSRSSTSSNYRHGSVASDSRSYRRQHFGNTPTPQWSQGLRTPRFDSDFYPSTPQSTNPIFSESRYVQPSPMPTPTYKQMQKVKTNKFSSEWEDDDDLETANDQDRHWYGGDEGDAVDMSTADFVISNEEKLEKKENELRRRSAHQAKQSQMSLENQKWEENQLKLVGLLDKTSVDLDYKTEEDVRVQIIVHDIKPEFMSEDESALHSQNKLIEPIVDPTCDLVVNSRKGSQLLREIRSQKDKMTAVRDMLKVEGTRLGNLLGITQQKEKKVSLDEVKDDSKFIKSLKKTEETREDIKKVRESLPIFHCKDELFDVVRDNPVTIIVGETGSGKTTQLAQYFYESGYSKFGIIACTQPRRVAAMSVAKRVSEEVGCELGETVGYSIRFEDCTSEKTVLKFMTDGVLLRECLTSPTLSKYSVIIMDEAHERSLNTDVLFGLLKGALAKRRDLKLIVTSATMDAHRFSDYFGNCPIYTIPGRTFPVKVLYSKNPVTDYVDAAVGQAISIHTNNDPSSGDILIFMTGQEDIEITCYILQERLKEESNAAPMLVLPIYSMLPSEMQTKIFEAAPEGTRKCIVATSIAETSLTVQGIYYVIDTGFTKLKVYNPTISMDTLQVYPESKAAADQRAGRAGRTGPGVCFRLFTKYQYENEMLPSNMPEIQRTNLGNVVLLLKSLGVNDVLSFDFMDPPPRQNLINSMHQLFILGALNQKGELTSIGRRMVNFPVDPSLSKMLIVADKLGCTNEISIIVSMLSVQNIFHKPKDREEEYESVIEKFFVPESDHLTLLHIFNQWRLKNYESGWCKEHFLNYRSLRRVREVRAQIIDLMKKNNIQLTSCGNDWDVVRKTICSAYFHHACRLKGIADYTNLLAGMPCTLHPSSALYGMGYTPEYVVYHELVMTTKEYMRVATAIEGEWLAEMAPLFFSIKEDRRSWQKKVQEEANKETEEIIPEKAADSMMPPPKVVGSRKLNLKRRIGL